MRLTGHGDWRSKKVTILFEQGHTPATAQRLGTLVAALAKHVFLGLKPMCPAQARWTGVANVARFALGLQCFHQILLNLFCSGADASTAKGEQVDDDQQHVGPSLDIDAAHLKT